MRYFSASAITKHKTIVILLTTFIASSIFAQQADEVKKSVNPKAEVPTALYNEILTADKSLFDAFNDCDSLTYKKYFTDDLEFYHDLGGLSVSLNNELQSFRDMCARGTHMRRELVKSSLEVYPIKDFGAVEIGTHLFFHTNKGETEKPSGTYKFIHVWKKTGDGWKIARVVSYGHEGMKN